MGALQWRCRGCTHHHGTLFRGWPHASPEQETVSLAAVHYLSLWRLYGPLPRSDVDFKYGATWDTLVPLWPSLPCFTEVFEKGKLGLLPKHCESQKKNKGINRYALSVSSESVVHLVGMDRCPHTFSCLKSLYYSLNMLSKYEASLNFRIFSCIISPAIHQSKMQNFSSSIYLCQFTLQLWKTRLVSKSLVDVLLVENWLHGRVNGVIKEHTGGQMERCKHRGKAGWRIRLKDCVDRWTVIHYGQMETEAVWKTEFLFNCDALEFVSIQNEKRVNTLAFFNKMEMFLNP